jgi:hypothetical protein
MEYIFGTVWGKQVGDGNESVCEANAPTKEKKEKRADCWHTCIHAMHAGYAFVSVCRLSSLYNISRQFSTYLGTVIFEISYTTSLLRLGSRKINPAAVIPDRIEPGGSAFQTAF